MKVKCEICGKQYSKRGIGSHIWRSHGNGINHNPQKNKKPWNKGLTKIDDDRIKKIGETFSKRCKDGTIKPSFTGRKHSKQTIEKLRKNAGGYRLGSGHGKKGWYKGIWCDSSWELAYVIYCLDHNINIQRCEEKFEYIFEDKKHHYHPDFIVDNKYVEIKGWVNVLTQSKINQFPYELIVLYKNDMKEIFDYVINKYGKDYIKLYGPLAQ
jgi:hypothetical protein